MDSCHMCIKSKDSGSALKVAKSHENECRLDDKTGLAFFE